MFSCKTIKENNTTIKPETSHNTGFYDEYSTKLQVHLKGNENRDLIRELSEWLGTPYKYGGNTREGTDCSGMVCAVFKKVYNKDMYRRSADQVKNVTLISPDKLEAGDLVFFKINHDTVSHVGIYIGENKFIHSSTSRGVIISSLDEPYYKKYFYSGGKVIL